MIFPISSLMFLMTNFILDWVLWPLLFCPLHMWFCGFCYVFRFTSMILPFYPCFVVILYFCPHEISHIQFDFLNDHFHLKLCLCGVCYGVKFTLMFLPRHLCLGLVPSTLSTWCFRFTISNWMFSMTNFILDWVFVNFVVVKFTLMFLPLHLGLVFILYFVHMVPEIFHLQFDVLNNNFILN